MILLLFISELTSCVACSHTTTCPISLQEDFIKDSLKTVETLKQDKGFQSFLTHSFEQRETALKSKVFQEAVGDFQKSSSQASQIRRASDGLYTPGYFYIFVSLSMGEKALLNLAQEAKAYGATLVLRGFIKGSYAKTVQALQNIILKTGEGFIIDPELFSLFSITAVPTYILAKPFDLFAQTRTRTPLHDRLRGHVSIRYALESFAQSGDLTEEAQALLNKRRIP
jgi:type-F conjugative transfer system pilin assembly protein TrbC